MSIKLSSKDAIIEAAFQLLNKQPMATLGEIAEFAGVGRATLHRHFASRQDLIETLAWTALDEVNRAIDIAVQGAQSHAEGLKLCMKAVIPLANRQWFLSHEDFPADHEITLAYRKGQAEVVEAIESAQRQGSLDTNLPSTWINQVYESLIYAAWTLVRDEEATPNQAADLAWRTFLKGVTNEH